MIIQPMQSVPKCRSDFERNINILTHLAENGKINLSTAGGVERLIPSLIKLSPSPNQRINFLSVDEGARSVSNTIASFSFDKRFNTAEETVI